MKNQNRKNVLRRDILLALLTVTMSIMIVTETATAKSLYVIADINASPTPIHAYDIGADGTLTFQAQHLMPHYMLGAVGLAIDSDSGYVFVTYEASDQIQLIDAATMTEVDTTLAPDTTDLAGIVYDHDKKLLYCVDRRKNKLFVYNWEPNNARLTHIQGSPFTLKWATPYGIALDEIDDLLYVANGSTTINVYRTSDWRLMDTITISRVAISIAVDVMNGFVYTGGGYAGNKYLTQYHLATRTESEVTVEPDAGGVVGLGVDTDTGLVYMSTGLNNEPGGDNLLVYNSSLDKLSSVSNVGNPTGLVIPGKDIGYNPLNLSKVVLEGAVGKTETGIIKTVGAGRNITYGICFDNYNDYTVTDVSIVDQLPDEVTFVTADDDGVNGHYDAKTHTYKWLYEDYPTGSSTCLKLTVTVKKGVEAGTLMTNTVTLNSNETPPTTTSLDVITTLNSLNLIKSIFGTPAGQTTWVDPNEPVTYNIRFDNNDNNFPVTEVILDDTLPKEVSFVTADGDGVNGHYDAKNHTYRWSYPTLPSGTTNSLELIVNVNKDIGPGTVFTNSVTIDCKETPPATATVDAITYFNPLNLSKSIAGSADGEINWVDTNQKITYSIYFDNKDNNYAVTNVSVVDTLPKEVTFVQADGDGIFGEYDPNTHTYIWLYSSLSAKSTTRLELVVQVHKNTAPGSIITNTVEIDSDETPKSIASVDAATYYDVLGLEKTALEDRTDGLIEQIDRVDIGDTFIYKICFENNNQSKVTNVSIDDKLPEQVIFQSATVDGNDVGKYDIKTRTFKWSGFDLPAKKPGEGAVCLMLKVRVNADTKEGTVITNTATIKSNETSPSESTVEVTAQNPLFDKDDVILSILPNLIRRTGNTFDVQATIILPQGIGISDIDDNSVRAIYRYIDPDTGTDNDNIITAITPQHLFGTETKSKIIALFDKVELLNAIPEDGKIELEVKGRFEEVKGRFKKDESFRGKTFFYIGRFTGN